MDQLYEALISMKKNPSIPDEDDWFQNLLGDWNLNYSEPSGRKVQGEWLFRRALDGMAIEDLFICPSRAERISNPQPDAEYGVTIRMYDRKNRWYDMTYICANYTTRLKCTKEDDRIICSVLDSDTKWIFSAITGDSFRWQNTNLDKNGNIRISCEVHATRKPL
ncbi:hypothetical protein [uncultured Sphaerochaeta sp.]|uniref:hypothetical protein n=1 Tax=uncultured Sphaerochaeta sp. TaxID=886478 RepID=UPI002A0A61BB|nr:hypothetical protein [uncultured Sphaerochaeta sp.]